MVRPLYFFSYIIFPHSRHGIHGRQFIMTSQFELNIGVLNVFLFYYLRSLWGHYCMFWHNMVKVVKKPLRILKQKINQKLFSLRNYLRRVYHVKTRLTNFEIELLQIAIFVWDKQTDRRTQVKKYFKNLVKNWKDG